MHFAAVLRLHVHFSFPRRFYKAKRGIENIQLLLIFIHMWIYVERIGVVHIEQ